MSRLRVGEPITGDELERVIENRMGEIASACNHAEAELLMAPQSVFVPTTHFDGKPGIKRVGASGHYEYSIVFSSEPHGRALGAICVHTCFAPAFGAYGGFWPGQGYRNIWLCSPPDGHSQYHPDLSSCDRCHPSRKKVGRVAVLLGGALGAELLD